MRKLVVFIFVLCRLKGSSQVQHAIALIPESLKQNASAVKRHENIVFEVNDIDRASLTVHKVISVLHEAASSELVFQEYTDRYQSVDDVEINLYDAAGSLTNKFRKKDLQSFSIGDGLITDGNMLYFRVPTTRFPVTVEYKYIVRMKGTLSYPTYNFIYPAESVQQSGFTAKIAKSMQLRYRNLNTDLKAEQKEDDKYKIYQWSVKELPALIYEEGSMNDRNKYPGIQLAPTQFQYDEYPGNLGTWASYGKWYYDLYKDQDILPADRVAFMKGLVKDAKTDREKAEILYKYMQDNFRYVSIQLGIGGFKPFSAQFTDQKKYGDCKALTNYMRAALKAVGIKSYPATINAGENRLPMDLSFPAKAENHVILCVPMQKDTVWLECTSKTNDFGVLGYFTENRNALLLTENGGVLVPTPKSKSGDNKFISSSRITINEDGTGNMVQSFFTSGEYRQVMQQLVIEKPDAHKEYAIFSLGLKQPDEFSLQPVNGNDGKYMEIKASFNKIPEFLAGSKMFIAPRLYKFWSRKLPKYDNRKLDYYFDHPFEMSDTTRYALPAGYTVDALPKPRSIECEYATYRSDFTFEKESGSVVSYVSLVLKEHKIPASNYGVIKSFFDTVLQEEAQRIVVKK